MWRAATHRAAASKPPSDKLPAHLLENMLIAEGHFEHPEMFEHALQYT